MGYQNFFATRTGTDIGAGDTAITLENVPSVTEGRLVLEARNATQREIIKYTGVSGNQITGVTRGEGGTTAKPHLKNALVEMNATGEDLQDLYTAFDTFSATNTDSWYPTVATFTTPSGYNKGNGIYDLTTSQDMRTILSPNMRFRIDRTASVAPAQSTLLNGTTQFASKASPTGISFTNTFTAEAWVYPRSYKTQVIIARTSGTGGWQIYIDANGRVNLTAGTSGFDSYITNVQLPLNKWVHIAGTMNMSAQTGTIWINGVQKGGTYNNTAATVISQAATPMYIGRNDGGNYFDGYLSDVRVWSTARTDAQIKDNMSNYLVGSETGLVVYYKLNGDFNDSTGNANNLTAAASATATASLCPYSDRLYGVVRELTASTMKLKMVNGNVIPNIALTLPHYSSSQVPFGFDISKYEDENKIAFKASRIGSNQSIPSSTFTTPQFNQEVYDYGDSYDHETYTFTAPFDGIYHFDFAYHIDNGAVPGRFILSANASGFTDLGYRLFDTEATNVRRASASCEGYMAAGATIKGDVWSGAIFTFGGGSNNFSGHLVTRM